MPWRSSRRSAGESRRESPKSTKRTRGRSRRPRLVDHEEIAGVGVRVEQAVHEDLLRVRAPEHFEDRRGRDAAPCERSGVRDRDDLAVAHGEDPRSRVRGHDARDGDLRVVREIPPDLLRDPALVHEIELLEETLPEFVEERAPIGNAPSAPPLRQPQGRTQQREIRVEGGPDPGVLHLHRDDLAGGEACAMDLGDGCGAQGQRVDLGEERLDRGLQLPLEHVADVREGERRDPALQPGERFGSLLRNQVVTHCRELTRLHERALQPAQPRDERPHACGDPRALARRSRGAGPQAVDRCPEPVAQRGGDDERREAQGGRHAACPKHETVSPSRVSHGRRVARAAAAVGLGSRGGRRQGPHGGPVAGLAGLCRLDGRGAAGSPRIVRGFSSGGRREASHVTLDRSRGWTERGGGPGSLPLQFCPP